MELLIGLDNKQWLPVHVEDSWNPDDDMRLMKSVFGHRYMITDGWGRDLLPPDNAPDSQTAPKEAQPSRRMKLKKSNCRSTGDGARAQESMGMAVGQVPLLREEDARERVPRFAGWPPAK